MKVMVIWEEERFQFLMYKSLKLDITKTTSYKIFNYCFLFFLVLCNKLREQ